MDDLSITKKMVFAFSPNYSLKQKQLNSYTTELGAFDKEAYEIDQALKNSREKLGDVLRKRQIQPETLVTPDPFVPSGQSTSSEVSEEIPSEETESEENLPLSTISDEDFTEEFLNNINDQKIMMEFIKKIGEKFSGLEFNEDSYDQLNKLSTIINKAQQKLINKFNISPLNDPSYNKLTTYATEIFNFKNMNLTNKKNELLNKIKDVNVSIVINYDTLNAKQLKRMLNNYKDVIDTIYPKYVDLYNDLKEEANTNVRNALEKSGNVGKAALNQLNKEISNSGLSDIDVTRINTIRDEIPRLTSMSREKESQEKDRQIQEEQEETSEGIKKNYPNIDDSTIRQILELNKIENKEIFISTVNSYLNQIAQLLNNSENSLEYIKQIENIKYLLSESIFLYETKFNQISNNGTNSITVINNTDNEMYSQLKIFIKDIDKQITQTKWNIFKNNYIEPVRRSTAETSNFIGRGIVSGATSIRNSVGKRMTYKKGRTWSNWTRGVNTQAQREQAQQAFQQGLRNSEIDSNADLPPTMETLRQINDKEEYIKISNKLLSSYGNIIRSGDLELKKQYLEVLKFNLQKLKSFLTYSNSRLTGRSYIRIELDNQINRTNQDIKELSDVIKGQAQRTFQQELKESEYPRTDILLRIPNDVTINSLTQINNKDQYIIKSNKLLSMYDKIKNSTIIQSREEYLEILKFNLQKLKSFLTYSNSRFTGRSYTRIELDNQINKTNQYIKELSKKAQPSQPAQTSTSRWYNPTSWFRKGGTRKIKRSRPSKNVTRKR